MIACYEVFSPPPPGILCACFNSAVCLLLSLRSNSGPLGVAVDGIGRIWVSERHQQVQSSEEIALAVALTPLFLEDNIEAASREPRTRRGSVKVFDNDVLTEIPRQRIAGICHGWATTSLTHSLNRSLTRSPAYLLTYSSFTHACTPAYHKRRERSIFLTRP